MTPEEYSRREAALENSTDATKFEARTNAVRYDYLRRGEYTAIGMRVGAGDGRVEFVVFRRTGNVVHTLSGGFTDEWVEDRIFSDAVHAEDYLELMSRSAGYAETNVRSAAIAYDARLAYRRGRRDALERFEREYAEGSRHASPGEKAECQQSTSS